MYSVSKLKRKGLKTIKESVSCGERPCLLERIKLLYDLAASSA